MLHAANQLNLQLWEMQHERLKKKKQQKRMVSTSFDFSNIDQIGEN